MAWEKKFEIKAYVPESAEPAGDMPEKWNDGLQNNAERMNDRRLEKIGNDAQFIQRVATPSSQAWRGFVDSSFVAKNERNASEINYAQAKNLATAFNDYNDKLNQAFATVDGVVAKRFKEAVANAKDIWARAVSEGTLRLTGDKIRGRSVAPIACFWLVGDPLSTAMLREGDELIAGAPYNVALDGLRNSLKSAIQHRLIQAGRAIMHADFLAEEILAQNTITAALLTALADPAKADAFVPVWSATTNCCSFEKEGALFRLHIQVGLGGGA